MSAWWVGHVLRVRRTSSAVALLLLASVPVSAESPWPMWGADRCHTHSTWAVGPSNPVFKWKCYIGENAWAPEVTIGHNGDIYAYTGSQDGDLCAISPNGVLLWRQDSGTYGTAAVGADGRLYTNYGSRTTRCHNPDGTVSWSHYGGTLLEYNTIGTGGWVYTGAGSTYYPDGGGVPASYGIMSTPVTESRAPIGGGPCPDIYAFYQSGYDYILFAKYLATDAQGKLTWKTRWSASPGYVKTPVVAPNGNVVCNYSTTGSPSYGRVRAYDTAGNSLWTVALDAYSPVPPSVAADGTIYVRSGNGTLYSIAPDGGINWTTAAGEAGSPVVVDGAGVIYVRTQTALKAYDPNGVRRWTLTFGGSSTGPGSPVFGADGTMYVSGADLYIYAFWDGADDIPGSRRAPDGAIVAPSDLSVTAVFGDYFYVESADRRSGIRAYRTAHGRSIGQKISISGTIKTDANGERYVDVQAIVPNGSQDAAPLGMLNKWVGGGNWLYDEPSGAGQQGVKNSCGLNNIGLLIRTTGRVTPIDSTSFSVDDGSAGGVKVISPGGIDLPVDNAYVIVTGVSSCEKSGSDLLAMIRIRTQSDIRVL